LLGPAPAAAALLGPAAALLGPAAALLGPAAALLGPAAALLGPAAASVRRACEGVKGVKGQFSVGIDARIGDDAQRRPCAATKSGNREHLPLLVFSVRFLDDIKGVEEASSIELLRARQKTNVRGRQ